MDGAVNIMDNEKALNMESAPSAPPSAPMEDFGQDPTVPFSPMPANLAVKPFTERQLLSLYQNPQIQEAHQFTEEFLANEQGLCFADFSLTEALNEYLRSRMNLKSSQDSLHKLTKKLEEEESNVWSLSEDKVQNEGVCHDKVKVVSIHRFQVAKFNSSSASNCGKSMRHIREELFEQMSLCSYKSSKLRRKVDLRISTLCQSKDDEHSNNRQQIVTSISILFSFQRKVISDETFVKDTRSWLDSLVRALVPDSSSSFKNRLLLLNHVLRCPAGVGHWASSYIQVPTPLYNPAEDYLSNETLNQMIAMLSVLFSPVKGRKEMLREYCPPESPRRENENNPWVVLDSDGEDEETSAGAFPLRENDYVAILHQFPFEALFKYLLKLEKGLEIYDPRQFSTTSFFKLFAFGTQFVNLLKSGLQLFSHPSYRQFAKRLGHIIKHTLEYISDHWQRFLQSHHGHPGEMAMLGRIEAEYNNFFLRSAKSIFSSSASSGMWQYLAVVPYKLVRQDVLWHALALYHFIDDSSLSNWRQELGPDFIDQVRAKLEAKDFMASFEDTLSGLPDTEVMFLLTTFANMAISRDYSECFDFINFVVTELLSIGFINDLTSGSYSKGCRDLINNIARSHPQIMSLLLDKFDKESILLVEVSPSPALYIVRNLDVNQWQATDKDFELLRLWLTQNRLDSNYSVLSRMIFSKLPWSNSDLLPWKRHSFLAMLIVQVSVKYAPETIAGNFIQDSVRHLSNLAAKLRKTPEQIFISWAWEICSRLRLHRYDRSSDISEIIDIDLDAEQLGEAVATKNPIAAYVAVQTSQTGHLVEDVMERGLGQLMLVLSSGHYDHVLECLTNVTPLFFDQPETLINSVEFVKIVQQIISIDQTLLKMAKDLVVSDFPGPVLKECVNMIAFQVKNFDKYRRASANNVLVFWVNVLTEIPGWMTNRNVLYALEFCCQTAATFQDGARQVKAVLKAVDQKLLDSNQESFFSWLSGSNLGARVCTSYTALMSEFPWTAFFTLEVEEQREETVKFWQILTCQLDESSPLDKCHKKILAEESFSKHVCNLNSLPIYKWCQLILDSTVEQPLQVVFAQKFFKYFTASKGEGSPRLGRYFFEGVINTHYFGRILSKFKSIQEFYKAAVIEEASQDHGSNVAMAETFQAFVFWLEDMFILDEKLHAPSMSAKMLPDLLASTLDASKSVDFLYVDSNQDDMDNFAKEWTRLHFREEHKRHENRANSEAPVDKFTVRLSTYDPPIPLPANKIATASVIQICDSWFCNETTFDATVTPFLSSLLTYASNFDGQRKEYASIMCNINEQVRGLYINEDTEMWTKGSCRGVNGPKGQKFECGGAAAICHKFCEAKLQSVIEQKLREQKEARAKLVDIVSLPIDPSVVASSAIIDDCVEYIMKMYFRHLSVSPGRAAPSTSLQHYHNLGLILFYRLCDSLGEESNACPMMRHLLTSSLERLGQAMIADHPDQCQPLLTRICAMPDYAQFLTAVFTPGCSQTDTFLQMYRTINDLKDSNSTIAFTLLSKMTVDTWINRAFAEGQVKSISRLISLLGEAFKRTGLKVAPERHLLHDIHRSHLTSFLRNNNGSHYDEVVGMLLILTDAQALDPTVWYDVCNSHFASDWPKLTAKSKLDEVHKRCTEFFATGQTLLDLELAEIVQGMLLTHFSKERRSVGLHGLYSKYRAYTMPLAAYQAIISASCLRSQEKSLDERFHWIMSLYGPWIIPLMEDQRQETAMWIQQFAEAHKVMFPWAPGDVEHAEVMLCLSTACAEALLVPDTKSSRVLSLLLETYCSRFARTAIKDFVLIPVHKRWENLPWEQLYPSTEDLGRLVTALDSFLPLCHEFLGKIFCRFPWKQIAEQPGQLAPFFIHSVVKLSAEPQVRQNGHLMRLISQDIPDQMWKLVSGATFDNLMHWYVMSVDARVILIEGSHPLDVKILSVLRSASQTDDLETDKSLTFGKSKTFLRCMIRLLSTCGSKHKNYIAQHENELDKSIRELVDDLGDLVISCHQQHAQDCADLVKAFLSLMNLNSVIPKFVMQSIVDCWLHLTDLPTAMVFLATLLDQLASIVACPSMISDMLESCLEAYFQDRGDHQKNPTAWAHIMPYVQLPKDKEKLTKCLDRAVEQGHCLLLFASLQVSKKGCTSITEEATRLISTLLDWLRHLSMNERNEPKLPLLFREIGTLCLRQLACGVGQAMVAKMLLDFLDVLSPLMGLQGQSWSILGVLGFSSKYQPSPRAKFLALSINYMLQSCILEGPQLKTRGLSNEANSSGKFLNPDKVSQSEKELENLLTKQAYFGLTDNIEWVLKVVSDPTTCLEDLENFFSVLVCDNLYTESFLLR